MKNIRIKYCLPLFAACAVILCVWSGRVGRLPVCFRCSRPTNLTKPSRPSGAKPSRPSGALTRGHGMTLALHISSKPFLLNNLYCTLLRSVVPFWPSELGKIGLIMDEESPQDHSFAAELKRQEDTLGVQFDIRYQPLPDSPEYLNHSFKKYRGPGYHRQMWNTYFLDVYVSTPVIAYTDSDVMFATPVTPEDIFNGDKLRLYSGTKWPNSSGYRAEAAATYTAIGKKMIGKCDPFPTFLWRSTVTNCRNHILKHLNVSRFEDAFRKIHGEHLAVIPMKIIVSYAFYFERDRYDWHFVLHADQLQRYNEAHLSPGFHINPEDTLPTVILTAHKPDKRKLPFTVGYCIAMRHIGGVLPPRCKAYSNSVDYNMFVINRGLGTRPYTKGWCGSVVPVALCTEMSERHYRNVARYHRMGLYDFNLDRVKVVEKVAAKMNVTCRPLE